MLYSLGDDRLEAFWNFKVINSKPGGIMCFRKRNLVLEPPKKSQSKCNTVFRKRLRALLALWTEQMNHFIDTRPSKDYS